MSRAIAVIATAAAKRLDALTPAAREAVEQLRRELEHNPRLGVLRGSRGATGSQVVYRTRVEPRPGTQGLTVVYVYTYAPHPPAVVIISVTPDDPADEPRP
ncbi:hypothetical protein [Streptomyces niveiscabiei]|uniref:Uncharacterized protein n=1 Tax=Streptomyces niveiscabiei TaxID=164115 RepID=A0ABW9I0A1_9ACTN